MMNYRGLAFVLLSVLMITPTLVAQSRKATPSRRAKPPTFSDRDAAGIFFKDVFTEGLAGSRPADLEKAAPQIAGNPAGNGSSESSGGGGEYAWSAIISPTTIEDEVKGVKTKVDAEVTTPGKFKGRGYKIVRREFSVLAMIFAIAGEYDKDVRWKDVAHEVRDVFARSAANAKVGTDQVYSESKIRKQELQDLVGGGSFTGSGKSERKAKWGEVVDRSPIMQRIESAHQGKLQAMTNSEANFTANKAVIKHEAEIIAAVSEVLMQPGMEDGEDDDYKDFAERMKKAALEVVNAVNTDTYSKASENVGEIGKACTECHEYYRA